MEGGSGIGRLGSIASVALLLAACGAAPAAARSTGWSLATKRPGAAAAAPAYLGNGYVGTRIPAEGAGYASSPVATETHIAGVYASVPDEVGGGTQRQGSINLPGWTQLDVVVAGRRFASADAGRYRQVLDLRRGLVTTRARWAVGKRVTGIRYDVALDRARKRLGVVRLRVTPRWSGRLKVRDVLGAGAYRQSLRPVDVSAEPKATVLAVRTAGTRTTAAEVARLRVPSASSVVAHARPRHMTSARRATIRVRAGRTYEVTKVVGFATSLDTSRPARAAGGSGRDPWERHPALTADGRLRSRHPPKSASTAYWSASKIQTSVISSPRTR